MTGRSLDLERGREAEGRLMSLQEAWMGGQTCGNQTDYRGKE